MNYYLIIPRCWGTDTYSQGLTAGLGINKITPSYLQYRCNPFSKRISSELSQSFQCAMLGFPKIGLPPVIIGFSMKQTSQLLGSPHDFGIIHFCHRIFYYKPSILDTSIYGNPQIQPTSYRMAERGGVCHANAQWPLFDGRKVEVQINDPVGTISTVPSGNPTQHWKSSRFIDEFPMKTPFTQDFSLPRLIFPGGNSIKHH